MKTFIHFGPRVRDRKRCWEVCSNKRQAFTIVELLVALTVLAIIVVLLAQVFEGVTSNTSTSTSRLQANSDVRNVMDRIGFDIESMIRQGGFTPIFNSNVNGGNNDVIAFLSNVRAMNGSATNTRLAAICYSIETGKTDLTSAEAGVLGSQPMLTRWSRPYEWSDDSTGTQDLTAFSASKASIGTATDAVQSTSSNNTYQVLNPDIFRLEMYFQLMDGTLSSIPGAAGGQVDWSIVQSIHLAVAVLDQATRLKMTSVQLLVLYGDPAHSVPSFLSDFNASAYSAASSTTPVTIWTKQIDTAPPSLLSPLAVKALRFYERSYDLH